MNTPSHSGATGTQDFNTLHDAALRRAHELRREAMADFWRGADAAFEATLATASRSAQRLAHRLARHARGRSAPADSLSIPRDGA